MSRTWPAMCRRRMRLLSAVWSCSLSTSPRRSKGVLAQHGNLTMDTAFDRPRSYARRHNLRLSAVAQQVIDTDLAAAVLATPATTRVPAARKR
jgi:ANTAR domain